MRLLILHDDSEDAHRLKAHFTQQSYLVDLATTSDQAFRFCDEHEHDVIVIGRDLHEDDNGVDVCRKMRREDIGTPVIMYAEAGEDGVAPTVEALDAGADDYVTEDIELEELEARVRAMVRRCQPEEGSMLRYDGVEIDVANRNVLVNCKPVVLTPREFALLEYLVRNRERVVSRTALGDRVWGHDYGAENSNVVDVYVSRLRKKLKTTGRELIHTVHGTGYMLATQAPAV